VNTFHQAIQPVWAGVAIRMSDGTIVAYELHGCVEGTVTVDEDYGDPWGASGMHRVIRAPERRVRITVEGYGDFSARFSDMASDAAPPSPAEIGPSPKEIEQ
jgi:hypothetical protein